MKRRVGALLMALVLVMTGFAAYAEDDNPEAAAVEDSVEDVTVSEEEPAEGESAANLEGIPEEAGEESLEAAEPEITFSEEDQNAEEVIFESESKAIEELQNEETEIESEGENIKSFWAQSGDLSVTVEAPIGSLPDDAQLYMQSLDADSDEYEEVQSYVKEQEEENEEASNVEIVDIYFTLDGEKVDPSEAVTVKLGLTGYTNADRSSLRAWDYSNRIQGTFNTDTQEVEFITANLQTFAVTWEDVQDSDELSTLSENVEEGNDDSLASLSVEVNHRSENEDDETYQAGTEIIFEVVVTNNGEVPISDIEVTNDLTAVSDPIALLETNDSETREVTYTITTYDEKAGSVEINVLAAGDDPEGDTVSDWAFYNVLIEPELEVTINEKSTPEKGRAYDVGELITYTVTVENKGEVTVSDVEVTCSPVDEDDPSEGKWRIECLEGYSKIESDEFTYTVRKGDTLKVSYNEDYAFVTIEATVAGKYFLEDETTANVDEKAETKVKIKPRKSQKFVDTDGDQVFDDDGEEATVNHNIVYLISYKNNGEQTKDITITDHLEEGLEYVGSNPEGEYISETGDVKWTLENVAPKTENYVVLTVKVVGNEKGYVNNRARVDGTTTNYVSNPIIDDEPKEPIKTVKASNGTKSSSVKELTYTIEYYNHHDKLKTVTITDKLDSSLTYIDESATDGGTYNKENQTITWEVNAEPGTDGKVSFTAGFDGGKDGTVENTASVTIKGDDPVETKPVSYSLTSDDSGTDTGLSLEKFVDADNDGDFDDDGDQVYIGNTLKYKITCKNNNAETKTVTITDEVDPGLTYVDGTATDGTYDEESRTITWNVTVEPSSETEVTFEATVNNANLKTETIEEKEDIETLDVKTGENNDEDEDGDGGGVYLEDDTYTSYITVTYKYMYNSAIAQIGDDKVESKTVKNYVYSESTSSGLGSGSGSDGESSEEKNAVNTADDTPATTMLALFGAAFVALGADMIYRRRRTQR